MSMLLNSENEKCYFYVKDNMMYERIVSWSSDGHRIQNADEDALARTSWAYICYGDDNLKEGIKSCFHLVNTHGMHRYYTSRHNQPLISYIDHKHLNEQFNLDFFINYGLFINCSRDQILYALSALKLRGNDSLVKEYTSKMPYRLSLRYTMTPDYKTWINDLNNVKINIPLHFFGCITHYFAAKFWNPFIKKNNKFMLKLHKLLFKITKIDLQGGDLRVMGFSWNLMVFMMISSKRWFGLRKFFCKILLKSVLKENILFRLLLGDTTVTQEEIDNVKPCKGWQWQTIQNNDIDKLEYLNEEESSYNTFDIDILEVAKEIGKQINDNKKEWIKI